MFVTGPTLHPPPSIDSHQARETNLLILALFLVTRVKQIYKYYRPN